MQKFITDLFTQCQQGNRPRQDISLHAERKCIGGSRIFERGVQVQVDCGNSMDCFIMAGEGSTEEHDPTGRFMCGRDRK